VPVVVAGVTTCQGGREGRPQGQGAQVIGHQQEPGGMRNAKRRGGAGCPPITGEPRASKDARVVRRGAARKRACLSMTGTSPCGLPGPTTPRSAHLRPQTCDVHRRWRPTPQSRLPGQLARPHPVRDDGGARTPSSAPDGSAISRSTTSGATSPPSQHLVITRELLAPHR